MVTCDVDQDISGDLMGWKLPTWQALLLHRVLPSCGGLIIYLTLMCFDLALVYEHFTNGDNGFAIFSLILMVIPALLTLVFTLASPPPGLKTDEDSIAFAIEKKDAYWILLQILNFLIFPFAAIGRYCHQIFWWIEAVFAVYTDDDDRIQEAVQRARESSPLELYLFLQSFLHAAPHAIVNILEMMGNAENPVFEKISLQSVSLVVSCLRMASTATIYRRFEREKLCGRRYPWENMKPLIENATNEIIEEEANKSRRFQEDEYPPPSLAANEISDQEDSECKWSKYNDLIDLSDSGSDYLAPATNLEQNSRKASAANSDEEYVRPISIIDRVAPRRRETNYTITSTDGPTSSEENKRKSYASSEEEYVKPVSIIERAASRRRTTHYTIETVDVPPPPEIPAPAPGRISIWAEKMVENAESIPTWLSAPPRRRHYDETIQDEPDIPRRVSRSYMRGLEPQDASAALVHYLGWYMFFIGRLLSIAAFINVFPVIAIITLFSHYQIMLLFLIVPRASTIRRGFYIFLAFIYLFCLMEFKVRFRHVRVWHVFWILVCSVETIIFTALWATVENELTSWWRLYAVKVVFISTLLSYMCMLVYFVILKPRETIVYVNSRKKPISYPTYRITPIIIAR